MTVYNKLKIAILATLTSQPLYAINVDPIQVQSAPGELLYAEMAFRQSDIHTPIEVSLATAEDLRSLGATHQPPGHLNFFTRRSGNGTGVITITSSRPLYDQDLNIIVKIKEGNAARLQHIKTSLKPKTELLQATLKQNERPLSPVVVVSEKDIALNLPVSTHYNASTTKLDLTKSTEKPLAIQRTAPPMLSSTSIPQVVNTATSLAKTEVAKAEITPPPVTTISKATAPTVMPPPVIVAAPIPNIAPPTLPTPTIQQQVATAPQKNTTTEKALSPQIKLEQNTEKSEAAKVQVDAKVEAQQAASIQAQPTETLSKKITIPPQAESSDPLVKQYAAELEATAQSSSKAADAKAQLKSPAPQSKPVQTSTAQASYVVQSNESLWKIASRIANDEQRSVNEVMKQIKQHNEHAFIGGDMNRLRRGASLNLMQTEVQKQPNQVKSTASEQVKNTPPTKTKYRLNQAEMSIVAENKQESDHVSATQNTQANQTSKELSLKVMTAREKTVKLQRNVTDLELALNQKDHRIQLLNARLAQLQQQLKAQQAQKKAN